MPSAPDRPRPARQVSSSVWWLALAAGVLVIGAAAFLLGSRLSPPTQVVYVPKVVSTPAAPAPAPVVIERVVERTVEVPAPLPAAPDPVPAGATRVVYVDLPVKVEVTVEKEVIREVVREIVVETPVPASDATLDAAPPAALPAWMKPGATVFYYPADGKQRSGRISALNSDFVIVLWSGGKGTYEADFARANFEQNPRPRKTSLNLPAAVAEEELKCRNATKSEAEQQEKLNAAWSNRRR